MPVFYVHISHFVDELALVAAEFLCLVDSVRFEHVRVPDPDHMRHSRLYIVLVPLDLADLMLRLHLIHSHRLLQRHGLQLLRQVALISEQSLQLVGVLVGHFVWCTDVETWDYGWRITAAFHTG